MTRSGNRRRRVPFYPATAGIFQPKEQQTQGSDEQEGSNNLGNNNSDRKFNGTDRHHDRQISGADLRDRLNNSSERRHDAGDRQSNGSDRRHEAVDRQMGGDYRYAGNGGDRRFEGSDRRPDMTKDAMEQRSHATDGHHRRSQSHDRPAHHHQHHHHIQKNQKWEGKDNNDQNKDPASTTAKELDKTDGKPQVKTQEYTVYMATRARELKEEGNRRFQRKDYMGAMDQYELALKLTPPDHPDRAVFHSNRAACLMQMKPVRHDAAIRECNLALEAHPGFARALLRRARAYEAVGKLELALQDVQQLLQGDVSHPDALDMAKRIRLSMGCQGDEAQQDLQGRPSTPAALSRARSSVGASAAVASSSGPGTPLSASRSFFMPDDGDNGSVLTPCQSSRQMRTPPSCPSVLTSSQSCHEMQSPPSASVLTSSQSCREMQSPLRASPQQMPSSWPPPSPPSNEMLNQPMEQSLPPTPPMGLSRVESSEKIIHQDNSQNSQFDIPAAPAMRPLKLIYDHDIRLAEMPVNCKFGELRKLVKGKFPSSKAILLKYRDVEGDLVTITSTEELRLAEAAAAVEAARRNLRMTSTSAEGGMPQDRRPSSAIGLPVVPSVLDQLRLHVVEVPAEQEPHDKEDVLEAREPVVAGDGAGKTGTSEKKAVKERDFDKWLLEFAHLFQTHLGIDPNGHVDFHDLGMELCAEALEETITTEEAHKLFEQAGCKFQEMVALGFFNWGNVFMCAARKEVPHDMDDDQMDFCEKLQAAFDWAHAQYASAEEKFQLSLRVKPDFVDGMLGLGQKDFESAKLNWSLAVASQTDLRAWDSSKTLALFRSAGEHVQKAAELLQKREESRSKDVETFNVQGSGNDDQHEQDVAVKTQVYLFWGNILYEQSQVEFRLGFHAWNDLLDAAIHKFEVAGASSSDITTALQKHLSSSSTFLDAREANAEQDNGVPDSEKIIEREENGVSSHGASAEQDNGVPDSEKIIEREENGVSSYGASAEKDNFVPDSEKIIEREENGVSSHGASAEQDNGVPGSLKIIEKEENGESSHGVELFDAGIVEEASCQEHVLMDGVSDLSSQIGSE